MFTYLWNGLMSVWNSIQSWVSEKISWLANQLTFWRSSQAQMSSGGSSGSSSNVPKYAVGTPFVPSDQLAFLHKGEMVIPAQYNPMNPDNNLQSMPLATEQHFHIGKLEFPNVRTAEEVKRAIIDLPRVTVQYTG